MEICIQTGNVVDQTNPETGYALIREAGFTAIDWNLDHAWKQSEVKNGDFSSGSIFEKSLDEVIAHYAEELAVIRKNGLIISQAHAPFPPYSWEHPEILDYAIGIYNRLIEYCDYIGCKNLVIHGISYTIDDKVNTPASIDALNMRLYGSLIPTLLRTNVTVCLENLFTANGRSFVEGTCADPHQAVEYIDTLNAQAGREVFGFCLDTGHLNLIDKDFRTYIPIVGKRIKALHVHDNDGIYDRHLAPFTGAIHWEFFTAAMREIGYEGDLDFETFRQTDYRKLGPGNEALVLPFLKMTRECGEHFRKQILG